MKIIKLTNLASCKLRKIKMALTPCRDCGIEISTSAEECKKCGCIAPGLKTDPLITASKVSNKVFKGLAIFFGLMLVLFLIFKSFQ